MTTSALAAVPRNGIALAGLVVAVVVALLGFALSLAQASAVGSAAITMLALLGALRTALVGLFGLVAAALGVLGVLNGNPRKVAAGVAIGLGAAELLEAVSALAYAGIVSLH